MIGEGKLFIDGQDAFLAWGAFLEDGGHAALAEMPAFKPLDFNDWAEEDGREYDLADPKLAPREFTLPICFREADYLANFSLYLASKRYTRWDFSDIALSAEIRLVSCESAKRVNDGGRLLIASFRLAIDDPSFEAAEAGASYADIFQRGWMLDGVDFSALGAWVLDGAATDWLRTPPAKSGLLINTSEMDGQRGDHDGGVMFAEKTLSLPLLIKAASAADFRLRWRKLFGALIKGGLRSFGLEAEDGDFMAFYAGAPVSRLKVLQSGKIWCELSLQLRLVGYRPNMGDILLAAEDGSLIVIDGAEFYVDLSI